MEVSVVRAVTMKHIEGGLSAYWKFILGTAFFNKEGHDLSKSGICLQLHDGTSAHLWLDLKYVVADEAALHYLYSCKGSAGIKPRMACTNIYNWRYKAREIVEKMHKARYHWTSDFDALVLHDFDSVSATVRSLEASQKTLSQHDFKEEETLLGWNLNPQGAMFDDECRKHVACKQVFDFMHVVFVQGVFNHCGGKLLRAMQEADMPMQNLHAYFKLWRLPKASPGLNNAAGAFHADRLRNSLAAGFFKCTASEALSIYPIWAQYCQATMPGSAKDHSDCFLRLTRIVALWQRRARGLATALELKNDSVKFLDQYKTLYGPDAMVIKFHYLLHLPMSPSLSCWVHERKHKWVKKYANNVHNTSGDWDRSVLREATAEHLQRLASLDSDFFHA